MYRHSLAAPFDRPEDGAWPWHEAQLKAEALDPERDFGPLQSRSDEDRCETCGKPAYAQVDCPHCGDEEQAA